MKPRVRKCWLAPITAGLPVLLSTLLFASISSRAQSDTEVDARKAALDLACAFTNDGFKIRDGHWCGTIKPNEHALIAVNLYAGNQYWFTAGATDLAKKIAVTLFDESGKQITTDNYNSG